MVQIVLNDEQAEILSHACEPVIVVDRSGRTVGELAPLPHDSAKSGESLDLDVATALERMEQAKRGKGIFYTTTEVLDHLQSQDQS